MGMRTSLKRPAAGESVARSPGHQRPAHDMETGAENFDRMHFVSRRLREIYKDGDGRVRSVVDASILLIWHYIGRAGEGGSKKGG